MLAADTTAALALSLDALALQIDEEQLNLYMDGEMDPELAEEEEEEEEPGSSWEAFDGWDSSVPGMVETDDSSNDIDEIMMVSSVPSSPVYGDGDHDVDSPPVQKQRYTFYQENPHDEVEEDAEQYADAERYADPESYWDDEESEEYHDVHNDSSSGFLQTIARQSVEFESDSEAADSWAQEPVDRFEQELHRHAQTLQSLQQQLELLQADAQVALL